MERHKVLVALLLILTGLLALVWYTDTPSPAYPHGRFPELVWTAIITAVLIGALASGVQVWLDRKGKRQNSLHSKRSI
jgi:lysylphosphatidylglycerol synthetase-like protein (DUF2156 family)